MNEPSSVNDKWWALMKGLGWGVLVLAMACIGMNLVVLWAARNSTLTVSGEGVPGGSVTYTRKELEAMNRERAAAKAAEKSKADAAEGDASPSAPNSNP